MQLSRELAQRGHDVLHLHCSSYESGRGAVERRPDDPAGFQSSSVALTDTVRKYSLWKRPLQEYEFAHRLIGMVAPFKPDIVLSGNTPILAQALFQSACRRRGYPFVFWQQDIYTLPMKTMLHRRLPIAGTGLGKAVVALEAALLRRSDAVVTISSDFLPTLEAWGVPTDRLHVIENWAPLAELPMRAKVNDWSLEHGLADKRVLLYSGTLGIKHDPDLLIRLAERFREEDDVRVVVITGEYGTEHLRRAATRHGLHNLVLMRFQPYRRLPDVLGSADVLLVLLEFDAGVFSVPSKVLTYLCASRPLVAAMPAANLAARVILRSGAGVVTEPDDASAFTTAVAQVLQDHDLAERCGQCARAYAESTFDIATITDGFEQVFEQAIRAEYRSGRRGASWRGSHRATPPRRNARRRRGARDSASGGSG